MLTGAWAQYLTGRGLSPVRIHQIGEHVPREGTVWSVQARGYASVEMDTGSYSAMLQIRTRADDAIEAEAACEIAMRLALDADGQTLTWVDPRTAAVRRYLVEAIQVVSTPGWYESRVPGFDASCNLRLLVTER